MADTRRDRRAPVSLKVRFKSATVDQFIEQYSMDVSRGGLFIKSKNPMPVGTLLKFEFQLKDESRVIQGVGRVVWMRMPEQASEPDRPPGMGVKFIKMDPHSRSFVERIVAPRGQKPAAYESGVAEVAPPPARPAGTERHSAPDLSATPFFPETTPEHEMPALEDRTQVRHASQFLASAVSQGQADDFTTQQAEEQAWQARRRTEELERQKAVAASLGGSGSAPHAYAGGGEMSQREGTQSYEVGGGLFGSTGEDSGVFEDESTNLFDSDKFAAPELSSPLAPPARASVGPSLGSPSTAPLRKVNSYSEPLRLSLKWKPLAAVALLVGLIAGTVWWIQDSRSSFEQDAQVELMRAEQTQQTAIAEVNERATAIAPTANQQAQNPGVADGMLEIKVSSDPTKAKVWIENEEKGSTPLALRLPKGKSVQVLIKARGYTDVRRQVTIGEQDTVEVKLPPLPWMLKVSTRPRGATITALGRHKTAPTTLNLGEVRNNFVLKAERPGFETAERVVTLDEFSERKDQMFLALTLELERNLRAPVTSPPATPPIKSQPPATTTPPVTTPPVEPAPVQPEPSAPPAQPTPAPPSQPAPSPPVKTQPEPEKPAPSEPEPVKPAPDELPSNPF